VRARERKVKRKIALQKKDLTMAELKEVLGSRELSIKRSKAELI